jgi:hypothetical protein
MKEEEEDERTMRGKRQDTSSAVKTPSRLVRLFRLDLLASNKNQKSS